VSSLAHDTETKATMDDSSKNNNNDKSHNNNNSSCDYHLLLEDDINNVSNRNIINTNNRNDPDNHRVALCNGTADADDALNTTAADAAYMLSPILPRNMNSNINNSTSMASFPDQQQREEAGGVSVHNDDSTRLYFHDADEDQTSLPSTLHQREDDDDDEIDDLFEDTNIDYGDPALYSAASHHSRRRHHRHGHYRYYNRRYAPLNRLNYLNAVTFLAHLFVSWGIGIWGLDGVVTTR
jgi:hypothetical protein